MAEELEPWIVKSQNELGAVIQAPKLTDKLLRKPPFRFLHDIVTSFLKTTGFPANLYSAEMLDSAKCTEKEQKLEFLNQLIEVVQNATGKSTSAKAAKIIAGAEPEGTNDLLQLLATCSKLSKSDQEKAVKRTLGGGKEEAPPPAKAAPAPAPAPAPGPAPAAAPEPKKAVSPVEEAPPKTPPQTEVKAEKREPSRREKPQPQAQATEEAPKTTPPTSAVSKSRAEVPQPTPLAAAGTAERPGTATARKPPPPTKGPQFEPEIRQEAPQPASGVIVESKRGQAANDDDDAGKEKDWMKIVEEHETAKSRAATATDAEDAKGYLGQQALKAKKEQEEAAKKAAEEARLAGAEGGLIINQSRSKDKSSAMGEGELSKLREQLQMLTKASNPLGKFLEAIHEDIDTMSRELEMWRTEARTQATAAREAQRQTEESLHDIYGQLQNLEDAINDQILKTNIARAAILNNDKTIDTMVRMVVNPEVGKASASGSATVKK